MLSAQRRAAVSLGRRSVSLSGAAPPPVLRPSPAERRAKRALLKADEKAEEAAYFNERTLRRLWGGGEGGGKGEEGREKVGTGVERRVE